MTDSSLAAVVDKPQTQTVLAGLQDEGIHDDTRHIEEYDDGRVAIPVTAPPQQTAVREVIQLVGEPRLRTLADHLRDRGWTDDEIKRAPSSWAVIGSVVLVDVGNSPRPGEMGDALLAMHAHADTVLAREGIAGEHREPAVEVIAGVGDTRTVHREHGTVYALDLAEVMFSPGTQAERARMGEIVDDGERVLDMFAGIGYFTLPMARNGARVTAVERNPVAFEYLVENVLRNEVQTRVETYRADCRNVVSGGLEAADDSSPFAFDRVVMGYYEAHEYLESALAAVTSGGTIHMHEATPEGRVPERPVSRLEEAATARGRTVDVEATRTVKGYSEGVVHVVVDAVVL